MHTSTKNVVIVSQVFYPDSQATSQLLSALAQEFIKDSSASEAKDLSPLDHKNFSVKVLCCYPSQARGQSDVVPKREKWGEVLIKRGGLSIDSKKSLFHRALSYGCFLLWLTYQLIFRINSHTEQILVVTNPPFAPLVVWFCSNLRRMFFRPLNYTILLHDLYPDGLIALNKLAATNLLAKGWSYLNKKAFFRARKVITLGRDMSNHCHKVYQLPLEKCQVITNWSPVNFEKSIPLTPEETNLWQQLPDSIKLNKPFIVQYSGNMGLWHNMDAIVEAASLIQDLNIHFLMIGDGRRKAGAIAKAQELGLSNITWLPFQDLATLTDSLQCAHISLVSQREEVLGIMVPSKFYGILASRRAVLAQVPAESEVALTIKEHNCGIILETDEAIRLAECLRTLYLDLKQVKIMGDNAGIAYEQHHSFSKAVFAFKKLLSDSVK